PPLAGAGGRRAEDQPVHCGARRRSGDRDDLSADLARGTMAQLATFDAPRLPSAPAHWREPRTVLLTAVLVLVATVVLAPVIVLIHTSFLMPSGPTGAERYSLAAWSALLSDSSLSRALWTTIKLTIAHQLISLPIAVFLSWLISPTDLPGRDWLEFGFWISFFLPPL